MLCLHPKSCSDGHLPPPLGSPCQSKHPGEFSPRQRGNVGRLKAELVFSKLYQRICSFLCSSPLKKVLLSKQVMDVTAGMPPPPPLLLPGSAFPAPRFSCAFVHLPHRGCCGGQPVTLLRPRTQLLIKRSPSSQSFPEDRSPPSTRDRCVLAPAAHPGNYRSIRTVGERFRSCE